MKILTFSNSQIRSGTDYSKYLDSHLLIIVKSNKNPVTPLPCVHRKAILELVFDDVEDISNEHLYFDTAMAREILQFVDKHAQTVSGIVVSSDKGVGRNVGIAAALSKIINGVDDSVFTQGAPNMLVYLTLLTEYFNNVHAVAEYNKIDYLRRTNTKTVLSPTIHRELIYRTDNRKGA